LHWGNTLVRPQRPTYSKKRTRFSSWRIDLLRMGKKVVLFRFLFMTCARYIFAILGQVCPLVGSNGEKPGLGHCIASSQGQNMGWLTLAFLFCFFCYLFRSYQAWLSGHP
jgi:hypothetical protein